jgi:hypothetical protein
METRDSILLSHVLVEKCCYEYLSTWLLRVYPSVMNFTAVILAQERSVHFWTRDSTTPCTSIVASPISPCHSIPTHVFNYKYLLLLSLPITNRSCTANTITKTETKDWRYLFHWKDISELLNDVPGPIKLVLNRLTECPLLKGVSNGANFLLLSGDVIELPRRLRISLCGIWARGRGGQVRGSPRKT